MFLNKLERDVKFMKTEVRHVKEMKLTNLDHYI